MIIQHDYYIARGRISYGNTDELKKLYDQFEIQNPTIYDGVSRFVKEDADGNQIITTRLMLRNFFSEKDCVSVFDL